MENPSKTITLFLPSQFSPNATQAPDSNKDGPGDNKESNKERSSTAQPAAAPAQVQEHIKRSDVQLGEII